MLNRTVLAVARYRCVTGVRGRPDLAMLDRGGRKKAAVQSTWLPLGVSGKRKENTTSST